MAAKTAAFTTIRYGIVESKTHGHLERAVAYTSYFSIKQEQPMSIQAPKFTWGLVNIYAASPSLRIAIRTPRVSQ